MTALPLVTEITDLDLLSLHPLGVYVTVFTGIKQRREGLWSTYEAYPTHV